VAVRTCNLLIPLDTSRRDGHDWPFCLALHEVLFSIGVNPRSSAADIPGIGFGLAGVNPAP